MGTKKSKCPACDSDLKECTCVTDCQGTSEEEEAQHEVDEFLEEMAAINDKALYPTDLKDAIIGMVERFGMPPLILLDRKKCLEIFMERDGMDYDEAEEFFEFNVIGSWLGDGTPCFATIVK
jgi:hypothetical protein